MANKRMFSLDVINTDHFMEMPISAQCLYFHLGMRADDDGFISNPKQIIRMVNCSGDDMKILVSKGYVIPFESGIVVIRHWKQNNNIRVDRYKETVFRNEKTALVLNGGKYDFVSVGIPNDIPEVYPGKDSIDKNSIDNIITSNNIICPEPEPSPDQSGILLPLVDKTNYDVPVTKIEKWTEAYPAVNVRQELQKMIVWLDSNPQRKKTKRGIDRFINTWLSREQDKGGIYRNAGRQQSSEATVYGEQKYYDEMYSKLTPEPDGPFK